MRAPAKYPTIAFTSRDITDLWMELLKELSGVTITVNHQPTKKDPERLAIIVAAFRKQCQIGQEARLSVTRYVGGGDHTSFDKVVHQALWALSDQVGFEPTAWGKYTELCPGFKRPS